MIKMVSFGRKKAYQATHENAIFLLGYLHMLGIFQYYYALTAQQYDTSQMQDRVRII